MKKPMPSWAPEEVDFLYSLAGDLPFSMAVDAWQRQAKMRGWPLRTASALSTRAHREGLKFRSMSGTFLTTGSIAGILGIEANIVTRWFNRNPDISRKKVQFTWIYRRQDLKAWATRHPHYFGGFPLSSLVMLFDDERLAERILEQCPTRSTGAVPGPKAVVCLETRRRYPSCGAAARAHYVSQTTISWALKKGHAVDGRWHFQEAAP